MNVRLQVKAKILLIFNVHSRLPILCTELLKFPLPLFLVTQPLMFCQLELEVLKEMFDFYHTELLHSYSFIVSSELQFSNNCLPEIF